MIALVQHRERMSSSLPASGTIQREYVQLETPANASWSKHVALQTDLRDGTSVPVLLPDGSQAYAVDDPHFMGPIIEAHQDRPVRIVFYNLLPTGAQGDLYFPVDATFMGAGMGPMAMMAPMDQGSVLDQVRNPMCGDTDQNRSDVFCRHPRQHPSARRHHPLDFRRFAAPVDHARQRADRLARGRGRAAGAGHGGGRSCLPASPTARLTTTAAPPFTTPTSKAPA